MSKQMGRGVEQMQAELFKRLRIVSASLATAEFKWTSLYFNKAKMLHGLITASVN